VVDLVHLRAINNPPSKATVILPTVNSVSVLLAMVLLVQASLHMVLLLVLLLDGSHLPVRAFHLARQVNFLDRDQLDHLVSNVQDQELLSTLLNPRQNFLLVKNPHLNRPVRPLLQHRVLRQKVQLHQSNQSLP
jgi:hypothetical protein